MEELGLWGVTIAVMTPEGADASVAASSRVAEKLAEMQFSLGEGPSGESFAAGRPVLVSDLAASDGRWLGFTPAALASGVGGVYAFPLGVGAVRLGVLTCYSRAPRTLQPAEVSRLLAAVDASTELLTGQDVDDEAPTAEPDLQASLHIRAEVYQAQGMLMAALGISLGDALARLRAMAFAEGTGLDELAQDLVNGRRPFPERD